MTPDSPTPGECLRADVAYTRAAILRALEDVEMMRMQLCELDKAEIYVEKHLAKLVDAQVALTTLLFKTVYAACPDTPRDMMPQLHLTPEDIAIIARFLIREEASLHRVAS